MIFKNGIKLKEHAKTMPIIERHDYWTAERTGYVWLVRDNVIDDPAIMDETNESLRIGPELDNTTPRIPPLDACNTGNLLELDIFEMDVTDMHRIPDSVQRLVFTNTNLTNMSQINVNWENIISLELDNNRQMSTNFLNVPRGIEELRLNNQQFKTVRTPETLQDLHIRGSYVNKLVGTLPQRYINMNQTSLAPLYQSGLNAISRKCDDETDQSWGDINAIKHKWHMRKLEYIRCVNETSTRNMYLELGSIKRRIKNPFEHRENPIVEALFLGSNYLRRSAEFLTEETIA